MLDLWILFYDVLYYEFFFHILSIIDKLIKLFLLSN